MNGYEPKITQETRTLMAYLVDSCSGIVAWLVLFYQCSITYVASDRNERKHKRKYETN